MATKVHLEAAEHEEQQVRQRQELAHQVALGKEAQQKAKEQRKFQMERRKLEEVCHFSFQIPALRTRLIFRTGVLLGYKETSLAYG